MGDDNLSRQIDEIEALASIYGDEWCVLDEVSRVYCIQITDGEEPPKNVVCLQVTLPDDYPSSSPPFYQLNGRCLKGEERLELENQLQEMFCENIGENILFNWVEKVREFIVNHSDLKKASDSPKKVVDGKHAKNISEETDHTYDEDGFDPENLQMEFTPFQDLPLPEAKEVIECPVIFTSPQIVTDRRSTFTAHLAAVIFPEQVKMVLDKLLEDKKIASATHNIVSYRIKVEGTRGPLMYQGCDDDGEIHAGSRMLHLMNIVDALNVMVVVTRWYGGVHLGPDRFKHINNLTRLMLDLHGYIKPREERKGTKSGKKKNLH